MTELERLFVAVEGRAIEDRRRIAMLTLIDSVCSDRERQVIRWRYFEEPRKTYQECADLVQVTRERIRQVEHRALRRLRVASLRFRRLYGLCETALPHHHEDDRTILDLPVRELELSVRAMHCLEQAKIRTIGELCQQSPRELLRFRNFGRKSLREIVDRLASLRLKLNGQVCAKCLEPIRLRDDETRPTA